jgi:hypothetical protein
VHLDHVVPGAGLQFGGRAGGHHPAVVDDGDVGGEPVGFLEVLGGQQHVRAGHDQVMDRVPQLDATARIQAGGRLVEQEQAGGSGQADAQVDAAAHAAGIGAHQPVGVGGELHLVEHPHRRGLGLLLAQPEQAADHLQVLLAGHRLLHGRELTGQADHLPDLGRVPQRVDAVDVQRPGVRAQQGGHRPHERGLPRAVGAQQRHHPARVDHEVQPGQRLGLAIALHQATGLQDRP